MGAESASAQVNIANLSLPLHIALAGSPGQVETYLDSIAPSAAETPGMEYTTVRSRFGHRLLERAQHHAAEGDDAPRTPEDEMFTRVVRSLHASFLDEMPTGSPVEHLFPHTDDSVRQMTSIQRLVGPRRAVLYPRQHHHQAADYRELSGLFVARSFQPKPKDMQGLWELTTGASAEEIKGQMTEYGFDDATPDTAHSILLASMVDRLGAAGLVGELHVSLGRTDLPPNQAVQSADALRAFTRSPGDALTTPEGTMIFNVFRHWRAQGGDYFVTLETATPRPWETRQARKEQRAALETIHGLRVLAGLPLSVHPS